MGTAASAHKATSHLQQVLVGTHVDKQLSPHGISTIVLC